MLAFLKWNTVSLLYRKVLVFTNTDRQMDFQQVETATLAKGAASKHFNRDLAHLCWF